MQLSGSLAYISSFSVIRENMHNKGFIMFSYKNMYCFVLHSHNSKIDSVW